MFLGQRITLPKTVQKHLSTTFWIIKLADGKMEDGKLDG